MINNDEIIDIDLGIEPIEMHKMVLELQAEIGNLNEEVSVLNSAIILLKNRLLENNIDISDLMPTNPIKNPSVMTKEELLAANKVATERANRKAVSADKIPMPTEEQKEKTIAETNKGLSKDEAISQLAINLINIANADSIIKEE